jgi:hypothetical protein
VRKVRCCGKYRVRAIIIILKKRKRKESARVQEYQQCSCTVERRLEREVAKETDDRRGTGAGGVGSRTEDEFLCGCHHV